MPFGGEEAFAFVVFKDDTRAKDNTVITEDSSKIFRRSIYFVSKMKIGEIIKPENNIITAILYNK